MEKEGSPWEQKQEPLTTRTEDSALGSGLRPDHRTHLGFKNCYWPVTVWGLLFSFLNENAYCVSLSLLYTSRMRGRGREVQTAFPFFHTFPEQVKLSCIQIWCVTRFWTPSLVPWLGFWGRRECVLQVGESWIAISTMAVWGRAQHCAQFLTYPVTVSKGCRNTYHRLGWLKTTKIYCLWFWRLQTQNQGAGKISSLSEGESVLCLFPGFWWLSPTLGIS